MRLTGIKISIELALIIHVDLTQSDGSIVIDGAVSGCGTRGQLLRLLPPLARRLPYLLWCQLVISMGEWARLPALTFPLVPLGAPLEEESTGAQVGLRWLRRTCINFVTFNF